jgi:tetratricopeptide (TPR) repeat protein
MGRSLENHVVLVDDAASIKHAQIVQNGNDYILEDLKSSNGTFLNGIKVQQAKLADGQKIRIGGATLVFEIVDLHRKRKTLKISLITMAVICVAAVLIKVLQPPDIAGEHLAQAHKLMDDGDPAGAKAEYEAALQIDPARMAAKQGIEEAKGVIEARDLLKKAEDAAMAEDYDNARELCYRVLRNFPNNSQALELKAVIKSIEDAKLAFTSHNWIDAKHLLEKVHDTYPKSKLVSQRLDDVHREIQAQSDMTRAKDAVEYKQYDDAQALLQSIPTNSVYSNEAKQLLDSIVQNREISDHLTAARSDFQNGKIPESLTELDAGLRIAPDDPGLADFQKHVRSMENLVKALDSAGVDGDAGLDRLLAGADICQKIIDLEADPLNVFRTRAQTTQAGITDKLTRLAGQYAASAQEYIKNNQPKEAYQALQMAMKANPTDQAVESQRDALFEKIELATKECYLKGYGLEGAGQIKLAINAYQDAINAGVPGEKYFNLATEKVKKLTAP